jgi:hypothetical protein
MKLVPLLFLALLPALALADIPDAKTFREGAMKNPQIHKTDGELFCWNAQIAAADLVRGYEATGDPAWLRESVIYFEFLTSKLKKDPDGREGWIGQTIWGSTGRAEHANFRADTKVGDAILLLPMVRFAELVGNDPALQAEFGENARAYVDLATRVAWEKWNARGVYYRDAAGWGSYHIHERFIDAASWKWVPAPVTPHSENLNKHSALATVILRLWRCTGKPEYRQRAEEVFGRLRHLQRYVPEEDRVTWNFWMPHGPHDIVDEGRKLSSWVDTHPKNAEYQKEEVARMVEAYNSGLVFDRADMQRLVNANHFMRKADGTWQASNGKSTAGTLWTALAQFDETTRKLWREQLEKRNKPIDQINLAYLDKLTRESPGWKRRFVKDESGITLQNPKPAPGQGLSATVVIPNRVGAGEKAVLVTQTRADGPLSIELASADGKTVLGTLHTAEGVKDGRVLLPTWDGKNPKTGTRDPGAYLIRFTLNGEVREEPAWVE